MTETERSVTSATVTGDTMIITTKETVVTYFIDKFLSMKKSQKFVDEKNYHEFYFSYKNIA